MGLPVSVGLGFGMRVGFEGVWLGPRDCVEDGLGAAGREV